jgi:hypothetical protein
MKILPVLQSVPWAQVVAAVVGYFITLAFYRLFLHPLAGFPGPKIAAVTRWYEGYHDVIRGGQYTWKIAEMHKRYGMLNIGVILRSSGSDLDRAYHSYKPPRASRG